MVWSKLIQRLDSAISTMSLILPSNVNKFITHTLFFLEMIVLRLIDCPYLKPNLRVMFKMVTV
jgi:hypothetical protein